MILQCPNCQAGVQVPDDAPPDSSMRCPACKEAFAVPEKAKDAPEAKLPEAAPAPAFMQTPGSVPVTPAEATPSRPAPEPAFATGPVPQPAGAAVPTQADDRVAPWEAEAAPKARPEGPGEEDKAGSGVADALKATGEAIASLPILGDLVRAFQPLVSAVAKAGSAISGLFKGDGAKEGEEGGGSSGGSVGAALGAVSSVAAGLVTTFTQLTSVAGQFVAALNPSLMQMLSFTFRDLQAVIGQALVPIIQQAVASTRFLADALLEPMRALRPVVAQLSSVFGGVLNALSASLAQTVTALLPAFRVVAGLFDLMGVTLRVAIGAFQAVVSIIAPTVQALSAVLGVLIAPLKFAGELVAEVMRGVAALAAGLGAAMSAMVSAVAGMFGGVGGWFGKLGSGIAGVVSGFVKLTLVLAAAAAKFLQIPGFVEGMIASLQGPKAGASTGMGAATNGQVTSMQGLTSSLYAAAFTSQKVGPDEEKKEDPMASVVSILKDIKNGNGNLSEIITKAIKDAIPGYRTAEGVAEFVGGGVYGAGRTAYDYTLGAAGGAIGNAANWAMGMPTV